MIALEADADGKPFASSLLKTVGFFSLVSLPVAEQVDLEVALNPWLLSSVTRRQSRAYLKHSKQLSPADKSSRINDSESHSGWAPSLLKFSNETVWEQNRSTVAYSEDIPSRGAKHACPGARLQQRCIRLYDSDLWSANLRQKLGRPLPQICAACIGKRAEQSLSKTFYASFLMEPPTEEDNCRWKNFRSFPRAAQHHCSYAATGAIR